MKPFQSFLSFLIIIILSAYSFSSLMPHGNFTETPSSEEFSVKRALVDLKEISKNPHFLGSKDHLRVRNYIVSQLKSLGLEVSIQEGFSLNTKWKSLGKQQNIIAKLKGSGNGKALLLLSHYDSSPATSLGASDAGSGVVTILESLRAYLSKNKTPKNDIVVLITDGEEIGLNGAKLFVNKHPWAKNIGLVLNFEARGSGGPSNMIVETNGGNHNLIKEFIKANPEYPVASSLMYSIYKMLPNDTDSTVFREDGDIDSFFFAFIDDHYDYHTANDSYKNLDRNTLAHQGSYLVPLVNYFADANLNDLKAEADDVYVNFPFIKMIHYPFSWVIPMVVIAILIFILLILNGIKNKRLNTKAMFKGFVPFLTSLLIAGLTGFFGWKLILYLYPKYNEIQHGFTYNGHTYIAYFVAISGALFFAFYNRFLKNNLAKELFIAPLFIWLIINLLLAFYLKGAAYFIIPMYFGLLMLWVLLRQEKPNLIMMAFLSAPAIFLLVPLVQFFPIGLGLKFLVASCVFTVLILGLLIPIIGFYKHKKIIASLFFFLAIGLFIKAHLDSHFSSEKPKPNSLIYYQDTDTQKTYWLTYDQILDDWTKGYLGENPKDATSLIEDAAGSKYNRTYTFASVAPKKNIPSIKSQLQRDTVINGIRNVVLTILPQRKANQISLYSPQAQDFLYLSFNGEEMPLKKQKSFIKSKELLRYYLTQKDSLQIVYRIEPKKPVQFTVIEYSFDLLDHPQFSIPQRPDNTMPKPFLVTDAIAIKKTIFVDHLKKIKTVKKDSL
ncbi:MAG: M20/M25/M40 family metallo-hydrolase [Flavobacteriales bacterium]